MVRVFVLYANGSRFESWEEYWEGRGCKSRRLPIAFTSEYYDNGRVNLMIRVGWWA